MLDVDISIEDIQLALKKMNNNRSPGPDGISIEFYKLFWNTVSKDLHEVFISGLEERQLAYSQYLAAIVLLYKKGPRPDIRNWRPISLLNTDYKLLSKVFADPEEDSLNASLQWLEENACRPRARVLARPSQQKRDVPEWLMAPTESHELMNSQRH